MSRGSEEREFRRVAVGTRVAFAAEPLDRSARAYFESITGNISAGGIYLPSSKTYPPGTLLHLRFDAVGGAPDESPVLATGIVRWRRRVFAPRGMGIEFVEFEGLGQRRLAEWLEALFRAA